MSMESQSTSQSSTSISPVHPTNLEDFLTYACQMYEMDTPLQIFRKLDSLEPCNLNKKASKKKLGTASGFISTLAVTEHIDLEAIPVMLTYKGDQIVQIEFVGKKRLPRQILIVLSFAIGFHKQLNRITIKNCADRFTVHDLCLTLPRSNITEIYMDNTHIFPARYDAILDHAKSLKILSLSRCTITDDAIQDIALKLTYPAPAAATLTVLNLSINRISDVGATHLGNMLKQNYNLSYLNLAGNNIADDGVEAILNALYKYTLTEEETLSERKEFLSYLLKRQKCINRNLAQARDYAESSGLSQYQPNKLSVRKIAHKAEALAEAEVGRLQDQRIKRYIKDNNGRLVCPGNNTLVVLNIAYNNFTSISMKLLLKVLTYQREKFGYKRGLVNVVLEGNLISSDDSNLLAIQQMLELKVKQQSASLAHNPRNRQSSIHPRAKLF